MSTFFIPSRTSTLYIVLNQVVLMLEFSFVSYNQGIVYYYFNGRNRTAKDTGIKL